jgi:hypothetical protein
VEQKCSGQDRLEYNVQHRPECSGRQLEYRGQDRLDCSVVHKPECHGQDRLEYSGQASA